MLSPPTHPSRYELNVPNSGASALSVISIARSDASGATISAATVTFEVTFSDTTAVPDFYRYPDGSSDGASLISQGGTVEACASGAAGCYSVTSPATSSFVAYSANTTSTGSDDDDLLFFLLLLLLLPLAMMAFACYRWGRPRSHDFAEHDISVTTLYPASATPFPTPVPTPPVTPPFVTPPITPPFFSPPVTPLLPSVSPTPATGTPIPPPPPFQPPMPPPYGPPRRTTTGVRSAIWNALNIV